MPPKWRFPSKIQHHLGQIDATQKDREGQLAVLKAKREEAHLDLMS